MGRDEERLDIRDVYRPYSSGRNNVASVERISNAT